jgi:hypothetical protein
MKDGMLGVEFGMNNDGSFSVMQIILDIFLFERMGLSYFQVVPNYDGILHGSKNNNLYTHFMSLPELVPTGLPQVRATCLCTFLNSDWERIQNN